MGPTRYLSFFLLFSTPVGAEQTPAENPAAVEDPQPALEDLVKRLEALPAAADAEAIQTEIFSAAKENGYPKEELRDWFRAIYEVLLGQSQGPRFGAFVEIYGVEDTVQLIRDALDGKFAQAA